MLKQQEMIMLRLTSCWFNAKILRYRVVWPKRMLLAMAYNLKGLPKLRRSPNDRANIGILRRLYWKCPAYGDVLGSFAEEWLKKQFPLKLTLSVCSIISVRESHTAASSSTIKTAGSRMIMTQRVELTEIWHRVLYRVLPRAFHRLLQSMPG